MSRTRRSRFIPHLSRFPRSFVTPVTTRNRARGYFVHPGEAARPAGSQAKEANMRKDKSAVLHLALSFILVVALIAISIPVVAAQIVFAPKMLKDGASAHHPAEDFS